MQRFDTESLPSSAASAQTLGKKANASLDDMDDLRAMARDAIHAANNARNKAVEDVAEAKRAYGTTGELAGTLGALDETFPEPIPELPAEAPLAIDGNVRSRRR